MSGNAQPMKTTGPRGICAQCQKPLAKGTKVVDVITLEDHHKSGNGAPALVETYHENRCVWGWIGAIETGVPNIRVSRPTVAHLSPQRILRWRIVE